MGIGFRLNFRWASSVKYQHCYTNSSSWPSSYSFRGMETSYDTARVSFPYIVWGETETMHNDYLRAHSCPPAAHTLSNDYLETEHINMRKSSCADISCIINSNFHKPAEADQFTSTTSVQASKVSHFGVLMNNLNMLEKTFADSDVLRLENDILSQLDRLGALKLFHTCLSRTRSPPVNSLVTEYIQEHQMKSHVNDHMAKIVVCSGKKEKRKAKRAKASEKEKDVYLLSSPSRTKHVYHQNQNLSSSGKSSKYNGSRPKITRNEAELTAGVKLVADLEKIKTLLEKETGKTASLSNWAEAAQVDKRTLQKNLHFGCYFKDELLRSTRSLIVYIARNYRGLGVGFEDLIQAGSIGVLQGAERFDHTRGCKFSTYIQYWIRKSILMLVERNCRGVKIPYALSKTMKKIQKARKTLSNSLGTYPDDYEIAKSTGLSLSKITSASTCLRVVGSLDKKIGDFTSLKYLELMPDTSIKGPEETVTRQNLLKDMYDLLDELNPRERQVLLLRLGLQGHHCMSLQEIGRLYSVSKEWIRKIERTALTKLRDQETLHSLNHYLYNINQ
ncbi:RNA polymerase sigma factor sigC [Heracleum sosnowskyi]|uniref:RNA polymerase sigma factor sigC n=1 Tax=Heracleum sosnowskyi TaxID=360622 RepID=A0AAD8HKG1_9APIA|nr:RNA polymerase sigma factor sigC [Heracleum sosnowskyi]